MRIEEFLLAINAIAAIAQLAVAGDDRVMVSPFKLVSQHPLELPRIAR